MESNYLPLVAAFVLSFAITPFWARWLAARQLSIFAPRARDVHRAPTPRLGGVVIALAFWLVVGFLLAIAPERLSFTDARVWGIDQNLLGVLLGSLVLVVVGVTDDIRGVAAGWKLFWQAVAAALLPLFGVKIQWLANPLGGANLELGAWLDGFILVAWVVLIINVINFLDGLDGLATGVSSIALFFLAFLALAPFVSQPALALLVLIMLGASLGFLPWNWHPARIFLGDSGSQLLGYILGVAAVISGGKLATAALILSLPILDALWAIVRRIAAGRSPFQADREHLHQRLLDAGLSQPAIVSLMMTTAAIFGIIALSSRTAGKLQALSGSVVLMIILVVAVTLFERRKNTER